MAKAKVAAMGAALLSLGERAFKELEREDQSRLLFGPRKWTDP